MKTLIFSGVWLLAVLSVQAQQYNLKTKTLPVESSIRGMCVVDYSTVWFSGSNGYIGYTQNAGDSIRMWQIPGYENAELRDIEVFDDGVILIMSATEPAAILRSADSGKTWETTFRQDSSIWFLDGMDFYKDAGTCIGDPINGHFVLLQTRNQGKDWEVSYVKEQTDSLAAFAASGSSIQYVDAKNIVFGTGGAQAKLFRSHNRGKTFTSFETPILSGSPASGIFCLATGPNKLLLAGGGDYTGATTGISLWQWQYSKRAIPEPFETVILFQTRDCLTYVSSIALLNDDEAVICGTGGTQLYHLMDGCKQTWENGFNVCQSTPEGRAVYLAGNNTFGRMSILRPDK
ncbi:MAG TPA: hypothetical protein PKL06_06690 [Chitinophagales bacterium]|nr:hypothetical protein [Chitinophagales bacterium]